MNVIRFEAHNASQELSSDNYIDMMIEARMALEPLAAELAVKRATHDDLEQIRCAYEDMESARTLDAAVGPDLRFHQAIVDATHNEVLRYMSHTLHNALSISIRLTAWHLDVHLASLPLHKAIYTAILNRDSEAAVQATKTLLEKSRADFEANTSA